MLVSPPAAADGAIDANQDAVRVLGSHFKRIERIRLEVAAFYGLPTKFMITSLPQSSDNVEFIVTSPTGEVVVQADLGIESVLRKEDAGYQTDLAQNYRSKGQCVRFKDVDSDLSGYHFWVHKYVLSKDKLTDAIKKFCVAPKSAEERASVVVG